MCRPQHVIAAMKMLMRYDDVQSVMNRYHAHYIRIMTDFAAKTG